MGVGVGDVQGLIGFGLQLGVLVGELDVGVGVGVGVFDGLPFDFDAVGVGVFDFVGVGLAARLSVPVIIWCVAMGMLGLPFK